MPRSHSRAEVMRQYWERLKREGRCVRCGEPADRKENGEHFSLCHSCREDIKKYGQDFRERNPDYNRLYWAENKDDINRRRRERYAGKTEAS